MHEKIVHVAIEPFVILRKLVMTKEDVGNNMLTANYSNKTLRTNKYHELFT